MARKYSIYKLISPSGRAYVGLTGTSVSERWRQHQQRAKKGTQHPLYNAIRKYGAESFRIEILHTGLTLSEANTAEIKEIAALPPNRYNVGAGGSNDSVGGLTFWRYLNANPEDKTRFCKRLSDIKKTNDWSDYPSLSLAAKKWRSDNAKIAYKLSSRALRIANKSNSRKKPSEEARPLIDRLRWKHNRSAAAKTAALKQWAECPAEKKKEIHQKISEAHTARNAKLSTEAKAAMVSKARSSIDRNVQAPAASKGLKAFWTELRKDPEKYRAYIDARRNSLKETNKKKADENIRHNQRRP